MLDGKGKSNVKYWDITENDVYVRVFDEMFQELDSYFFPSEVVHGYQLLSLECRYLVTRLFCRTIKWISYYELIKYLPQEKLDLALQQLISQGWLRDDPDLSDLLEVSSRKDIQAVLREFSLKTTGNRQELVRSLTKFSRQKQIFGPPLAAKVVASFHQRRLTSYKLDQERVKTLRLVAFMFLCPAGASLDTVIRTNMKLISFAEYPYTTQKEAPLFACTGDFLDYFNARLICDPLEEATACDDSVAVIVMDRLKTVVAKKGPFSASYVYGRASGLISRLLSKTKNLEAEYKWIEFYLGQESHQSMRASMYTRKLHLELKFFEIQKETAWLHRGLNTYYDSLECMNDIEKFDFDRKVSKLLRALEKSGQEPPPIDVLKREQLGYYEIEAVQGQSSAVGQRTKWGDLSNTVEETVLLHYDLEGWEGGHFENGFVTTLFGLIFHDIIFGSQNGFVCRYQARPLGLERVLEDLMPALEQRLATGDLVAILKKNYDVLKPCEPMIFGVNWSIPLDGLLIVSEALGPKLRLLLDRLLDSYSKYNSGFPDLTLWRRRAHDNSCDYLFVEVKSENDVISDSQYVWIRFMQTASINVLVCKVRDSKKRQIGLYDSGACDVAGSGKHARTDFSLPR